MEYPVVGGVNHRVQVIALHRIDELAEIVDDGPEPWNLAVTDRPSRPTTVGLAVPLLLVPARSNGASLSLRVGLPMASRLVQKSTEL